MRPWLWPLLVLDLLACAKPPPPPLAVAAAADLAGALEPLAEAHRAATGELVTLSYGASGWLATQLKEGAPFDLFLAADESFARRATEQGACDAATLRPYARGRLALWQPKGSAPLSTVGDLADARFRTVAIANPDTAPYGRAAKEALQRAGVWDAVAPRLVRAENVRQALQMAQSGNAEVAVVGLAQASAATGVILPIPATEHAPLVQTLVECRGGRARAGAAAFARRLLGDEGQAALRAHGFDPP